MSKRTEARAEALASAHSYDELRVMSDRSTRDMRRLAAVLLAVGIPYAIFLDRSIQSAAEPSQGVVAIAISCGTLFLVGTMLFLRRLGRVDVQAAARELKTPRCAQCGQKLPDHSRRG